MSSETNNNTTVTKRRVSMLSKTRAFVKKNWLLLLIVAVTVWWFCFREESKLDMFKNTGSSGVVRGVTGGLNNVTNLTTTPRGLASFLRK